MSLSISQLQAGYGNKQILSNIELSDIPAGKLTVLLGPNAAGKSTLFKCLAGLTPCSAQSINLHGDNFLHCNQEQRFSRLSYLPQVYQSDLSLSVFEVILLGCKPFGSWRVTQDEIQRAQSLLAQFEIHDLTDKSISQISGGQQQLAAICQVLARDSDLMLFDEPTSALDLRRQLKTLQQLKIEAEKRQAVCIISVHDLNLAATFADQIILMHNGSIKAYGETHKVLESGVLAEVYQVDIKLQHRDDGRYSILPSLPT